MFDVVKRPLAKKDLNGIWHYTYEKWGEAQATSYLEELEKGIKQLVANPKLGKSRETLRTGYRSIQIGRHIAYYTIVESKISIRRVLHERMDPLQHL